MPVTTKDNESIVPLTDSVFERVRVTLQPHDLCLWLEDAPEEGVVNINTGFCVHPNDGPALAAAISTLTPPSVPGGDIAATARELDGIAVSLGKIVHRDNQIALKLDGIADDLREVINDGDVYGDVGVLGAIEDAIRAEAQSLRGGGG